MRALQALLNRYIVDGIGVRGSAVIAFDEIRKRVLRVDAAEDIYVIAFDRSARIGGEEVTVVRDLASRGQDDGSSPRSRDVDDRFVFDRRLSSVNGDGAIGN